MHFSMNVDFSRFLVLDWFSAMRVYEKFIFRNARNHYFWYGLS